jgi:hypothetical protein
MPSICCLWPESDQYSHTEAYGSFDPLRLSYHEVLIFRAADFLVGDIIWGWVIGVLDESAVGNIHTVPCTTALPTQNTASLFVKPSKWG